MGAGISGWRLARRVAQANALGLVSGTALERIFIAKLQQGDIGGHYRRALRAFPDQVWMQTCNDWFDSVSRFGSRVINLNLTPWRRLEPWAHQEFNLGRHSLFVSRAA